MIARIVGQMPKLESLVVPSAPNREFFSVDLPKLKTMRIEAGYSPEDFISNFASSEGFPSLSSLDFSEISFLSSEEERRELASDIQAFKNLFESKAFESVRRFTLRNTFLSIEELKGLQAIRPELQFLVIKALGGTYVGHM